MVHMFQHSDLTVGAFSMHRGLKRPRELLDGDFDLTLRIMGRTEHTHASKSDLNRSTNLSTDRLTMD